MTNLALVFCIFASFSNSPQENEPSAGSLSATSIANLLLRVPTGPMIRNSENSNLAVTSGTVQGKVDWQYVVPRGWAHSEFNGYSKLEKSMNGMYDKYSFNLFVMPTEPMKGSLRQTFAQLWNTFNIGSDIVTTIAPLPMMTRLKSGYACAFDVDDQAKNKKTGVQLKVALYLVAQGDRVAPVLGIFFGYDKEMEGELEGFLESARIAGSSGAKVKLFTTSEIAGDWNTSSSSFASYVTLSGAYAGDASTVTASGFNLLANGSYKHSEADVTSGVRFSEKNTGTWSLDDNDLVLKSKSTKRYIVFGYGADPKVGRFLVLSIFPDTIDGPKGSKVRFSDPRGPFQAEWFRSK